MFFTYQLSNMKCRDIDMGKKLSVIDNDVIKIIFDIETP